MQLSLSFSKILILSLLIFSFTVAILTFQPNKIEKADHDEIIDEPAVVSLIETPVLASSIATTISTAPKAINEIKLTPKPTPVATKPTQAITVTPTVWQNIIKDFSLDHKAQSPQVKAEIRKLLAEKGKFNKILIAASPYIYYIHMQTKLRGFPAEIALLPFIESEFNPNDRSNKGAIGLWQLMAGTARILGVKINTNYDGRRNLVASTKAAMIYFKDLSKNFKGDWLLALAAYNCGQGKVESAIRHAGSKNFWNLKVPTETKYYVPKLLAVAEIVSHPKQYHIQLPTVVSKPYFSEFKIKKPIHLSEFAKNAGFSLDTLNRLNPDYKLGLIPKEAALLVPIKKMA